MTAFQGPPSPSRRALREEQRRARPLAEEIDDSQIAAEARPSGRRARAIVTDGVVNFVAAVEPVDATVGDLTASSTVNGEPAGPVDQSIYAHATGAVPTTSIPFIMTTQTPRDSNSVVAPAETYVSPYSRRASTPEQTVDAPAAEDTLMDQPPTTDVTADAGDPTSTGSIPDVTAIPVGDPIVVDEPAPVDPVIVPREERTLTRRELRALRAAEEAAAAAPANPDATEEELAAAEQAAADARKAGKLERKASETGSHRIVTPEEAAEYAAAAAAVSAAPQPADQPVEAKLPVDAESPVEAVAPAKSGRSGKSRFGRNKAAAAEPAAAEPAAVEPAAVRAVEAEQSAPAEQAPPVAGPRAASVIPPLVEPAETPAPALSDAMAEFEALTRGAKATDSDAVVVFPVRLEPEATDDDAQAGHPAAESDPFASANIAPAAIDSSEAAPVVLDEEKLEANTAEHADDDAAVLEPADIEPADVVEVDAAAAEESSQPPTYVPPVGHWSRQDDDDDENQPPENTISREVGGGNNSMSTNALVLPLIPQRDDFSSVLSATGEILVTGTINLPGSVGATGRDQRHYDDPEVDRLFDSYDQEMPITDSAPVRAISAVSSHTATRGGIESSGKNSNRMLTVLLVSASGMAAVVLGLLVTGFVLNIF
jgi:hypothetical protein